MTKTTTTKVSLDQKSQLAKLLATENITIQHNNVRTASFDVKNRVLTLPIFKTKSPDVYDMLIAHECSHALFTPYKSWAKIEDKELRAYVNVLEDCRIDLKIQKKYPGVVKNYLNGFDILNKANFFGVRDKDLNKDLHLIDKINMFYKSSKRLPIYFDNFENIWISKVNAIRTFTDVVKLAKEMLNWQKKKSENDKKDPNFKGSNLDKLYVLKDDHKGPEEPKPEESDSDDNDGDKEIKEEEKKSDGDASDTDVEDVQGGQQKSVEGGDGKQEDQKGSSLDSRKFIAITDKNYHENTKKIVDVTCEYNYCDLPEADLNKVIISTKTFLKEMRQFVNSEKKQYSGTDQYLMWLRNDFKKYCSDNMKTVNYLVKEFEMKKSATAYKRATTDKTGTIDPLKLKDYKFSDDIFKRLTILPTEKNHGMMMLLDWSGSMAGDLKKTIDQLINLVYFCRKINIPFKVYAFTTEYCEQQGLAHRDRNPSKASWKFKSGNMFLENFNLIELANHTLKKKELEESLMYVYNMGLCYGHYSRRGFWNDDCNRYEGNRFHMPAQYNLGTTPLNEALVACLKIVPLFKRKYNIEKMTFITLTDGGANYSGEAKVIEGENGTLIRKHKDEFRINDKPTDKYIPIKTVLKVGKKQYVNEESRSDLTALLLTLIQKEHGIKTIGFYVLKTIKWWDISRFTHGIKSYITREKVIADIKKKFVKEKCAVVSSKGYNRYFLLNGKTMAVQNTDLSTIKADDKVRNIKATFSKSMKGRITSRTLLNKFIEEVA